MRKILVICILSLGLNQNIFAQRPINIDSLRKVFSKLEKNKPTFANDTSKVILLEEITAYHLMMDDSGRFYSDKMLLLAQKINWKKGIAKGYIAIADSYLDKNPNGKMELIQKALTISQEIKDEGLIGLCYNNIAIIHHIKGNLALAIKYYELGLKHYLKNKDFFGVTVMLNLIGACWADQGIKKNALKYFQKELKVAQKYKLELAEAFALSNSADILIDSAGQRENALAMITKSNQLFAKLNRPLYLAQGEANIGHNFMKNKEYKKALPFLLNGWNAYQKYNWSRGVDDYNLDKNLHETYKNLNQPAKALFHLERYSTLLDSSLQNELKTNRDIIKVQEEKKGQENQINKLKISQLAQEKKLQQRTNNFLWAGLALLSIIGSGLLWYNRKLSVKNKALAEKNEIITNVTHKIQTTEIKALRAQMNPHFIFNCLNSIQYFTANNQTDEASEYLTKFSKLIRLVLENSRSEKVTLENELETLKLYIEMEAMRFRGKVKYKINVNESLDISDIQIPPLLIQPFVENAIWHGLMHKEEGGEITIDVNQVNESLLHIEIIDNGVGREKAIEYKSKSATKNKSFGMKVTAERIDLINQLYKTDTKIEIIDLKNEVNEAEGTKVIVEIPF